MGDMKRKDIQRLAHQLTEGIDQMRTDLANAEAKISNQTAEIERLRALCNDLHHDATCTESFCRLCGEGITEWEARRG